MSLIIVQSAEEFTQIINSKPLVVVDFHAVWCGPCKMIAPKFEAFAKTYPNVTFLKVDVDSVSQVASTSQVSAMPTFHFYKNGTKIDELVGADVRALEAKISKLAGQ